MSLTTVAELRSTLGVGTLYDDATLQSVCDASTVVITGNGSKHNGSKTITGVGEDSITYNISGNNNTPTIYHPVQPLGQVAAETYVDWTLDQAVQNASLMIATEIWQSRTATLSGSNLVDYQPSPYRMSAQLLGKVRGLLAHALSPSSMIG